MNHRDTENTEKNETGMNRMVRRGPEKKTKIDFWFPLLGFRSLPSPCPLCLCG